MFYSDATIDAEATIDDATAADTVGSVSHLLDVERSGALLLGKHKSQHKASIKP